MNRESEVVYMLMDFIEEWNTQHGKAVSFMAQIMPVVERPVNIEVRYPITRYREVLTLQNWQKIAGLIELNSHGTMLVATGDWMFQNGIIEVKVASQNHNYSERIVVGTLRRIAEEFFGIQSEKPRNSGKTFLEMQQNN